jgi:hypothetical protein
MTDRWTILAINPLTKVEFVAQRYASKDAAERAAKQLTRGGLVARCVPWQANDFPGYPRRRKAKP